jgi:hypothetical protein
MVSNKAVVKSGVQYADKDGSAAAPCGEYELSAEAGAMRFISRATTREFTLSLDAFCRFVSEGRIATTS